MIVDVFATDTIIRERYPLADDGHGNQVADRTAEPDLLTIPGCSSQPGATQEIIGGGDATLIQYTVFAPPAVDVLSTDDVRFNGVLYTVDGHPAAPDNWLEILDHTVVLLKLWEG